MTGGASSAPSSEKSVVLKGSSQRAWEKSLLQIAWLLEALWESHWDSSNHVNRLS